MKTYEIKMNRSRWTALVIGILCVVMIVTMLMPYFTYGKETTVLTPEMTDEKVLLGKTWLLSALNEDEDGYEKLVISDSGKGSTLYTTNILRVNQIKAYNTFKTALDNYNSIAQAVEDCDIAVQKCEEAYAVLEAKRDEVAAALNITVEEPAVEEDPAEETPAEGEEAAEAPVEEVKELTPEEQDYAAVEKSMTTGLKKLNEAKKFYETAKANLALAEEALNTAYEAVEETYAIDASFGWVAVSTDAYNQQIKKAYPEEYKAGYAVAKLEGFQTLLSEKYPEEFEKYKTDKNPLNKFYEKKMPTLSAETKAALYDEFFAAGEELTGDEDTTAIEAAIEVLDTEMSNEQRDTQVFGLLDEYKAQSNAAAAKVKTAQNNTETALKEGSSDKTAAKANKDVAAIEKEIGKVEEIAAKYIVAEEPVEEPAEEATEEATEEVAEEPAPEVTYTAKEPVARKSVADFAQNADELETAAVEDVFMETECTVKYKNGNVTINFANGDVKETTYATSVNYDSVKTISLLGYLAFPTDVAEFNSELAYQIKDYYINQIILIPIILLVLGIIGVILAITKRDSYASGVCPTLAGVYGILTYTFSKFMKLGDHRIFGIVLFAIMLVVGAYQLAFGIKEYKEAKKQATQTVIM